MSERIIITGPLAKYDIDDWRDEANHAWEQLDETRRRSLDLERWMIELFNSTWFLDPNVQALETKIYREFYEKGRKLVGMGGGAEE